MSGINNPKRKVLYEAAELIDGDRNVQYGEPSADFQRTAIFWNEYIRGVFERQKHEGIENPDLEPHDVASMQILLKLSRQIHSPEKYDHDVDIAGYTGCRQQCIQERIWNREAVEHFEFVKSVHGKLISIEQDPNQLFILKLIYENETIDIDLSAHPFMWTVEELTLLGVIQAGFRMTFEKLAQKYWGSRDFNENSSGN